MRVTLSTQRGRTISAISKRAWWVLQYICLTCSALLLQLSRSFLPPSFTVAMMSCFCRVVKSGPPPQGETQTGMWKSRIGGA